ncbi:hypothetical protein vseg_017215 [Gypsophila vaccaria]
MAHGVLSRTRFRKLDFLAKQLHIFQLSYCKSFTSTQNPQSLDLPDSLQDTHCRKKISLANLFQRYGFPSPLLQDFIAKNKSLSNSNVSELEQSLEKLNLSFNLNQNEIVSLVCSCPCIMELEFLKKWEVGIVSLGSFGRFSGVVRSVLEVSRKFGIDPDRYSSYVAVLRGFGFSDGTIIRILEVFPEVVIMDELELSKKVDFWILQGFKTQVIDEICYSFPKVIGYGVENRLKPLLNEFVDLGFGRRTVREEIVREPRILSFEVGELRRYLELLQRLRCRDSIKEKIFNQGEFKAGFAVKQRVDCLCGYGLTRRDALNILKREPRAITYDIEDIEAKVEFLLENMKYGIDSLIEVPEYLGVNFDKQIVPRHNVIEYLRSRDGLGVELGLRDIVKPTRLKFYNLYVKPYPECEKLYGRFSEYAETKSRHPVGLWKCFKPPQYPESSDDVKNLRSFSVGA